MTSRAVWKYQLQNADQTFEMPLGSKIIHVGGDGDVYPALWAEVVTVDGYPKEFRTFRVHGTGHGLLGYETLQHVGTCRNPMGLVWHVYEVLASKPALQENA